MLSNKTAVITGCNRGIGREILRVFASNGAGIFACARKKTETDEFEDYLSDLKTKYNTEIIPVYFDFADEGQVKEAGKQIRSYKKNIDILVNNAGAINTALFQMTSLSKAKEIMDINFFAQMQFTQYILKLMLKQKGGSIINIASSSALDCNIGRVAYSASKSAVITMTKTLSKEVGQYNIRVNAIAPGLTMTDMMRDNTPQEVIDDTLRASCLKRIGKPEEVANAALFLASELSSFITSQVIRVDGGMYGG